MACEVRRATENDLPTVGRLLADLVAVLDDTEGIDANVAARNCRHLLSDAAAHLLVAEEDGTAVGFISFSVRQTVLHRGPSGLIDELVVAGKYRGRGIGSMLVMAAGAECRRLGCCEIEVSTEKTNREAAEFYRRCGFAERGVLLEADL